MPEEISVPKSLDAERTVLGCILLDGDRIVEVQALIHADVFSLDAHRRIYKAMQQMEAKRVAIDLVTLSQWMMDGKELAAVGGAMYLASLTDMLPRNLHMQEYAGTLLEKFAMRELMEISQQATDSAHSGAFDAAGIVRVLQDGIERVVEASSAHDEPHVTAYSMGILQKIESEHKMPVEQGITYGMLALDEFTKGMRPGEVTVVGARSGVGKSSLMTQAAVANCKAGIPVHLFSLEMTREQVLRRIYAIISSVPFRHVDSPHLASEEEMMRIRRAAGDVMDWPLRIHDKSEMHITQILALAQLSIRRNGTRLVAVDYAQNISASGKDERTKVSEVSRSLTAMIKHQPASLMLLSQLRKVDREHYSRPPVIADLRETGQLENDCHCCLLLHRGWDEEASRISDDAEIIIAKQRRGDTGALKARFSRRSVTFE